MEEAFFSLKLLQRPSCALQLHTQASIAYEILMRRRNEAEVMLEIDLEQRTAGF